MRLAALAIALAAVLTCAAPASAATHNDPAGDNCKVYVVGSQWCGFDISTASDTAKPDGVHLSVTYAPADCRQDGAAILTEMPSFEIYDATSTAPVPYGHLVATVTRSLHGYDIRGATGVLIATSTPIVTTVGGTTTFDVPIPAATAATFGAFKWLASNSCIGELPHDGSDIAPNTGLFSRDAASAPVTKAVVANAVVAALTGAKAKSATTLLAKGGFPVTVNAPAAGTLKVKLTARIKLIRVAGSNARAAFKVVTIAKLTANATRAGKVTRRVKLTSAGKTLLQHARAKITATLTVSFASGAQSASRSKTTRIAPRKHS